MKNFMLTIKEFFGLALLGLALVFLIVYYFFHLMPMETSLNQEMDVTKSAETEVNAQINDLINNHSRFLSQKSQYDLIESTGFFSSQDRLEVRRLIMALKDKSELLSVRFEMGQLQISDNTLAQEVDRKLVKSEISFDLQAIEDTDIYNFFFLLNQGFPGIIEVKEFNIDREVALTQPVLRQIGAGEPISMVKATIKINWWSFPPSDAINIESTSATMGY